MELKGNWRALLLAAGLYAITARLGMAVFALQPSNVTLLWLPAGIGMVMCLRYGRRAIALVVLASIAANYPGLAHDPAANTQMPLALTALVSGLADGLGSALAALAFRRQFADGLSRVSDLLRFALLVCLLPCFLSCALIAANMAMAGYIGWSAFPEFLRNLVLADCLGILLVYPLYQFWPPARLRPAEWRWLLGSALVSVVLIGLAFHGYPGCIYFVLPVLLLLAFRAGLAWLVVLLNVSMIGVIAAAARHPGPFQAASASESHFMLISFVCSTTLVILSVALTYRQLLNTDAERMTWQQRARHDALTGLWNREAFMPLLQAEHVRVRRTLQPYVIAMLDLDHFKDVNDRYGHAAGDAVLVAVAQCLSACVREIDVVARIGGEEFGILFPDSSLQEAQAAMERICHAISQHVVRVGSEEIGITISCGICESRGDEPDCQQVMMRADERLYMAKHGGRNRVVAVA